MRNIHYSLTQGEAKTLRFYLEPEDATTGIVAPVTLTGWTVSFTLKKGNVAVTGFVDLACTNDPDQVANKSVTRRSLTALQTAALAAGDYRWHLSGTDPSGNPFRFPNTRYRNYGTLKVWPA